MAKRVLYFDLLSIISCFAVVCLHCNGLVHSFQPIPAWDAALVVEVLAYWAVPVFFMLTGANNMGYREKYDTKTFLARRMKKLVIPFVFWSTFIYLFENAVKGTLSNITVVTYINDFMSCSIEPIYWFFFAIISLTLAMPVLSLLKERRNVLWYIVVMVFILQAFLPYGFKALDLNWNGGLNLPVASVSVMYVVLGYLLSTQDIPKKYRIAVYVAAIACFALRYGYTYVTSYEIGGTNRALFSYDAFTAILPATAVFLLFKYHDWSKLESKVSPKAIATLSGCGFGIYLIHKMVLDYVFIAFLAFTWESFVTRLICPFIIYAIAAVVVYVMKKIPVVKELVP